MMNHSIQCVPFPYGDLGIHTINPRVDRHAMKRSDQLGE